MTRCTHWVVFTLLLFIYAMGSFIFLNGPKASLELVHWHQPLGILVLILTIWRLIVWVGHKKGETGKGLKHFLSSFSWAAYVQFSLLICCTLMPILGILMCFTGGYDVHLGFVNIPPLLPKNPSAFGLFMLAHNTLAAILAGLILLHIAGAIRSYFAMRALKKKLSAMSFDF